LQILAEMLKTVKNGARKTRIMYQTNLSFSLLKRYLDYALETDLISMSSENNGYYFATAKGHEFLEKYDKYLLRNKQFENQVQAIARERAHLEENYVVKQGRNDLPTMRSTSRQS
jgi:predicted transcriptional regulator